MSSQPVSTLYVTLKPIDAEWVQLRYQSDGAREERLREGKNLRLAEIQGLIDQGELHYYVVRPNLEQVGQQLWHWLDGEGRWLQREIDRAPPQGLVLAIAAEGRLAHLPWEVLHDGHGFLVTRGQPIVPVRWVEQSRDEGAPLPRSLQVMFMATSPQDVQPLLNFEQEEAEILRITEQLPLTLRVEESGCVAELGRLWRRYPPDTFDVFHLTGHASIRDGQPYFITETLAGDRHDTTAAELVEALEYRLPRLVFLSGCRTAEAGDQGSVGSMAEQLVRLGVPAVLGWGRPVLDTAATVAAAHLYQRLAEGYAIAQAVGSTYRCLLKEQVRDWHLLRLHVGGTAWGALVNPPEDYVPVLEPIRSQFLDPEQNIRVATPEQFVGRRRLLQRSLRQLQSAQGLGLLLYGMGGVGKSTIAARLLERLPDYTPIVFYKGVDEKDLLDRLERQCTSEVGHQILQSQLPLMQRLTKFWREGLNQPKQKFCLVLDDFEANLELRSDGQPVLKPQVVQPLLALLRSIEQSKISHRVIITSRYDVVIPELNHRLHRESVPALWGADLSKKYDRLESFSPQSQVETALQQRAKTLADGNPRLLEWLDKVLQVPDLDTDRIFDRMAAETDRFRRVDILAAELLKQQADDLKHLLARGAVFHLPVPDAAMAAVCQDINKREQHRDRAIALGLLEFDPAATAAVYRVPQLLLPLLPPAHPLDLYPTAAQTLYRLWWQESETSTEEQCRELHRLALVAGNAEIAAEMGNVLSRQWNSRSRYREVVEICRDTLKITSDAEIYYNLAQAELTLGEVEAALQHYQQTLELTESIGDVQGKAATLHCMAIIYAQQGQVQPALELYQQSLATHESIGNVRGKAATLHQMAGIYAQQGQVQQALELYQQSLALKESIGDVRGKAATLHCMAIIYAQQGQVQQALELYQQSLAAEELIGDVRGKAATLHEMAGIYAQQGQVQPALELYQQSLALKESIGNVQGKAATLAAIAYLVGQQGETEQQLQLNLQAAEALARIGAYPDLVTVLGNLGSSPSDQQLAYLSQALWLSLRLQISLPGMINRLSALFQAVPPADPLEPLLATTAYFLCATQGETHPDLESLQNRSLRMLSAAAPEGTDSMEALQTWMMEQQLNDAALVLPRLDRLLVEAIGDHWLFEPQQVQP